MCDMPAQARLEVAISHTSTPNAYTSAALDSFPSVSSSGGTAATESRFDWVRDTQKSVPHIGMARDQSTAGTRVANNMPCRHTTCHAGMQMQIKKLEAHCV